MPCALDAHSPPFSAARRRSATAAASLHEAHKVAHDAPNLDLPTRSLQHITACRRHEASKLAAAQWAEGTLLYPLWWAMSRNCPVPTGNRANRNRGLTAL